MSKILVFCAANIPAVKVAVMEPIRALAENMHEQEIRYFYKNSEDVSLDDFADADTVICVRGSDPIELAIMEEAKKAGKYTIYFLDDNLLDLPEESSSRAYFENKIPRKTLQKMIAQADCLWTDNPNIQKIYEPQNAKTALMDLMISPKQKPKSERASLCKERPLKIGFAGCMDHERYLNDILPEIIGTLRKKYPGHIDFEFFGAYPEVIDSHKLRFIPFQDNYADYVKMMKKLDWDIAIAPLPNTSFHRCKYFNKFLEYSSFGLPAIYSKVEPYTFIVKDGFNGLYAEDDAQSWITALSSLIENEELRNQIASQAYRQLISEFSEEAVAARLKERIPALHSHRAPNLSEKDLGGIRKILKAQPGEGRTARLIHKIRRILRIHRARAPLYVIMTSIEKIKRKNKTVIKNERAE